MQPDSVNTTPPQAFEAWYASGRPPGIPPDASGGQYHLLCLSEDSTLRGARRLSQAAIRASFGPGWTIESIERARMAIRGVAALGEAWLARFRRI